MHRIERVLDHLKPVARPDLLARENDQPRLLEGELAWQIEHGRLALAHVREDEAAILGERVTLYPHLRGGRGAFGRRFVALARAVEAPAMIDAADVLALHPSGVQTV